MVGCNREEALRARELAIKKMENKDFVGAQKIVLKAQKLYPELENVSQLLTICSVHRAAELRVNGEMDFYGVLQVEEGADQALIKKQYRKLAISLHPDKNCFAGAEAAFKLIAEAHSVLSDTAKRNDYDLKRRNGFRHVPKPAKQQQSKRAGSHEQSMAGSRETFWTICSNCNIQYQYYSNILNTMVRCLNCKKNFFAYKLNQQPKATSSSVPNSSHAPSNMFGNKQRDTPNQQGQPVKSSSVGRGTDVKPNGSSQDPAHMFRTQQRDTCNQQGHPLKPSSVGRGTDTKPNGSQDPPHLFQNQQHGVYSQNGHPVKPSAGRDTDAKLRMNVAQRDEYMKGKANDPEVLSGKFQFSTLNQDKSSVPMGNGDMQGRPPISDPADPNIVNTQKSVQQDASAVPDTIDLPGSAKPSTAGGKIDGDARINVAGSTLMPDPVDLNITGRRNLHRQDACTVPTGAGSSGAQSSLKRKTYVDGNVCLDTDTDKRPRKDNFPSDVDMTLEQLCDNDVTNAGNPKGESSCRMDLGDDQIAQKENHPEEHIGHPMCTDNPKNMCPEQNAPLKKTAGDANEFNDCSLQGNLSSYIYTYPDSDFHKFEESRSCEKFERGQIWALYNDIDKLPKLYAWIKKVREEPFRVEVIWLEACPKQDQEKQWMEQDIPISSGTFKILKWKAEYDTSDTFSHRVYVRETSKKREFEILPEVGDIWAVYMKWAPDWIPCSVDDCEFAICEVIECTEDSTKLTFLAQVSGYRYVLKPDKQRGVLEVPAAEKLRFSHQIPFFRLTGEGGGRLRGFYELDPASVPDAFLYGGT